MLLGRVQLDELLRLELRLAFGLVRLAKEVLHLSEVHVLSSLRAIEHARIFRRSVVVFLELSILSIKY